MFDLRYSPRVLPGVGAEHDGQRCALSGIPLPELLNASHIIPWIVRQLPRSSGERAGVRGPPTPAMASPCTPAVFRFPPSAFRLPLSAFGTPPLHTATLRSLEGRPLTPPDRFPPDREALAWHREVVFRN